jgi:long-chain acyl-CoA synthetase
MQGAEQSTDERVIPFDTVCSVGEQQEFILGRPNIHEIPPEQMATIVHTSGTSGNPKGVMLSHFNIVSNVKASLTCLPVGKDDVGLSFLPLSHIFERTVGQFAALSAGGTIAYAESIETIQANLQEVRPTLLITVPRLLEKIYAGILNKVESAPGIIRIFLKKGIASDKKTGFAYRMADRLVYQKLRSGLGGRLRYIVSGSSSLGSEIADFFIKAGVPVYEGYGMTEASPVISANPFGQCVTGTVGKPVPGVQVRLAADGELLVKGPNVMLGYYNNPEATAETIDGDGWLHTGDIAEIEDGYVKIVDRKKNIMVLATGKNVAPGPIENAIVLSAHISQAVLIGDKRKYVACLLVPDFEALRPVAERLKLGEDRADWVQNPEIRNLLADEVRRATAGFADFERPKRAVVLSREMTLETGELTPSLKVKNKLILQRYEHLIEDMYSGVNYLPILGSGEDSQPGSRESAQSSQHARNSKSSSIWFYAAAGVVAGLVIRLWIGG